MFPSRFRYEAPHSLDEAIGLLRDGGDYAKVLAGGQSLVPMMKLRFASPELIVDINNLPGLAYHRADPDGSLRIGALCRHADLEFSDLLKGTQPTMAAAAPLVADPLVRNRGTLVGSLCHADPQGDWASVMLALGGSVIAAGPGRQARHPAGRVRDRPVRERAGARRDRGRGRRAAGRGVRSGGYLKLERRVGDFATVGVAVAIETSGTTVIRAGIALTGVGGSTIGATEAAAALTGKPLTADSIAEAAELAAAAAQPRTDHRGTRRVQAAPGARLRHPHPRRQPGDRGRPADRGKGGLTMTMVYDDLGDEAADEFPVRKIKFTINGKKKVAEIEPRLLLADLIRRGVGLTGTHRGCDTTNCGACTVLVDGRAIKSCTMLAVQVDGREVTTVEGLAIGERAAPDPGGVPAGARAAVRVLHAGHDDGGQGRCSTATPTRPRKTCGGRCPATCAAAPATRTS